MLNMQLSAIGLTAIKARESLALHKYPDAGGFSIGYGHFIKRGENFDDGITEAQADDLLARDVLAPQAAINHYVENALTQNQFDALVSFVYNIGAAAFLSSTLLHVLNAGYRNDIVATQIRAWRYSKVNGKEVVNPVLVARREQEVAQFNLPDPAPVSAADALA